MASILDNSISFENCRAALVVGKMHGYEVNIDEHLVRYMLRV